MYTNYKSEINSSSNRTDYKTNSIISSGKEVLIPASGESALDISIASSVVTKGLLIGGDINIITPKQIMNNSFLALALSNGRYKRKLSQLAQGKSVVHLYNSSIKNVQIFYPHLDEQIRVKLLIAYLEKVITLHQRKLVILSSLKKEFIDNLIPYRNRVTPMNFIGLDSNQNRLKTFKIKQLLIEYTIKTSKEFEHTLLSSTNKGIEYRKGRVSGESNLGYKVIEYGDLVLSPQNLWLGNININKLETGIVSPSYKTFKFTDLLIPDYFSFFMSNSYLLHQYKLASIQGASIVRRNLDIDAFNNIEIILPDLSLQKNITELLNIINKNELLISNKLRVISEIKNSFLKMLFV